MLSCWPRYNYTFIHQLMTSYLQLIRTFCVCKLEHQNQRFFCFLLLQWFIRISKDILTIFICLLCYTTSILLSEMQIFSNLKLKRMILSIFKSLETVNKKNSKKKKFLRVASDFCRS